MFKDEAIRKAKKTLYLKVFFPLVFILNCLIFFFNGTGNFSLIRFLGLFIALSIVLFLPFIIFRLFVINSLAKKYENQFLKNYYQEQSLNENYQYQKQFNREMERKRKELEIEFEHLKKIILLTSSIDESKIRIIHQMEQDFKNQQNNDLDSLNAQIQRMKRDLL